MAAYRIAIDRRAEETRSRYRQQLPSDLGDCMRWALHMSEEELAYLEAHNPDFDMNKFIKAPEARAFMIGTKV